MKQLIFEKTNGIKAIAWLSSLISSLDNKKYVIEVKQYRKKRSLDANAYCWVLIDKLAEIMFKNLKSYEQQQTTEEKIKETIYKNAIRDIGGVSEIVCVKNDAVNKFRLGWEHNGLGWQTEILKSKFADCTNVIVYYGSSAYDTSQMSRLIDNIVQDCKAAGIETMTPAELEVLKQEWK